MSIIDTDNVTVVLPSGKEMLYKFPVGLARIQDENAELHSANPDTNPVMALAVNGVCTSITRDVQAVGRVTVEPIFLEYSEGKSLYRRSLVFVMLMAAENIPGLGRVVTEHGVSENSYLCEVDGGREVTEEELDKLRVEMKRIVAANLPITERLVSYNEALAHLSHSRPMAKALVETRSCESYEMSCCDGFAAPLHRALTHRTGLLCTWSIQRIQDHHGFMLLFPGRHKQMPQTILEDPIMQTVFREYNAWGRLLNVSCTGDMNHKILNNDAKRFVAISEGLQSHKIVEVADMMRARVLSGKLKMVLIAGPSASGKTTFASKLGIQLRIMGCVPVVLTVDNYFKPRAETPLDEKGEFDFEVLEALRVGFLNEHLVKLMDGEVVDTPIFDFHTGLPKADKTIRIQLPPNGVLIMEGIHCLNPALTPMIPDERKFRVFLAPLSQLNLDEGNFCSHAVGRLIRRIVRDYNHRGYSARDTIARWDSVSRGEDKHIFPYLKCADVVFNTALDYETSVLKTYASPLLRSVKPGNEQYNTARNVLRILDCFYPIPHDYVPPDSLLREFIGGSIFEDN